MSELTDLAEFSLIELGSPEGIFERVVERSATSSSHVPLFDRLFGPRPGLDAVRVLSLDGGGVRGIISSMVFLEIVKRTGRPITELFDHVAGTSTGSILACGLTAPHPDDPSKPLHTAEECFATYLGSAKVAMGRDGIREHLHAANLFSPKFHNEGLNRSLREGIGTSLLSEAVLDLTVPAYEIVSRRAMLFSRSDARAHPSHDFRLWEVARASSAAPTFFEPHEMVSRAGGRHVLIDGGMIANNPSMAAFADIERRGESRDMVIVSIGTGAASREFGWPEVQHWGVAQWARPIVSLLLDSSSQAIDFELRHVLGRTRYHRFQLTVPHEAEALDNVTDENIDRLLHLGQQLVKTSDEEIDRVCELLVR